MVGKNTWFNIVDNSGGQLGECIKVLKSKWQKISIGKFVIIVIKRIRWRKKMKVKEHDVRRGIVVRLKKSVFRFNGLRLSFSDNAIVLLDKKKNPLGNRIYGPLPYEIREKKLMKLVLMAPSVF